MNQPDQLITTLNLNPRNPRRITPQQLEALRKSLSEFGDLGGIVLNRRTGHLVGGHQRITAFNLSEVPVTITEKLEEADRTGTIAYGYIDMDGARYSYREVHWDEAREAAANIAANRHGGEFDDAMLADLLAELKEGETFDPEVVGYTSEEIDKLIAAAAPPEEFPAATEDIQTEYRCPKCGYVWSGRSV